MYVLDSSVIIEAVERGKYFPQLSEILGDGPLITTSICAHEILVGALSSKERFALEGILSSMRILDHDMLSAKQGAEIEQTLTRQGMKINRMDCLVAGICKTHHAHLLTLDKDFAKIKDLKVTIL